VRSASRLPSAAVGDSPGTAFLHGSGNTSILLFFGVFYSRRREHKYFYYVFGDLLCTAAGTQVVVEPLGARRDCATLVFAAGSIATF
jgi:hypothetical protein